MTTSFNSTISLLVDSSPRNDQALLSSGLEDGQPSYQVAIQGTLVIVTWLCSVPANLLVCLVIYRSRRIQSTTNYFVVSMALSDLMFTLLCVPFVSSRLIANRWMLGPAMCRLVRFLQLLAPTSTTFVLLGICIDRFYTIIYPLSFKITRGTAKRLIVSCWVLSLAISIFAIYFFEPYNIIINKNTITICPTYIPNNTWISVAYGVVFLTITYFVPLIIITVIYSRIFRFVWTPSPGHRLIRRTSNSVPRTKVKMLKMLMIVTMVTLLCHAPNKAVQMWYTVASVNYVNPCIFVATFLLIFLTTVLKPAMYMLYNSNFRRGCREVFCMSNMKCYRSHTYAITTPSQVGKKNHVGVMPQNNNDLCLRSPSFVFKRVPKADKMTWPMDENLSTTYL